MPDVRLIAAIGARGQLGLAGRLPWDRDAPELCEFCGAYSPRSCELRDEMNGVCPSEESAPDSGTEDGSSGVGE